MGETGQLEVPLLVVRPASAHGLGDGEVSELVYRALDIAKPSAFEDAIHTPLPAPLPKNVKVHRSMAHFIEFYRYLTRDTDPAQLSGIRVLSEGAPELRDLQTASHSFKVGVVYAQHPANPHFFIPLANFHDYLVEDKHGEFLRLVGGLGATCIEFRGQHDHRRESRGGVGGAASTPKGEGSVNASAQYDRRSATKLMTNVRFKRVDRDPPHVPEGLCWFPFERGWQTLAELRLRHGVASYAVDFEYSQDFTVTAKLAAKVASIGLECGGTFKDFESVHLQFSIEFEA